MTKSIASHIIIAATIMGLGSQIILHQLDKATAEQCRTHAWPQQADQIHRDWCITNGYKI